MFGDLSISLGFESEFFSASLDNPQQHFYTMQENIVESEENIFNLGLGFLPVHNKFFAVNHYKTDKIFLYEPNVALLLTFNMDPDTIIYRREV